MHVKANSWWRFKLQDAHCNISIVLLLPGETEREMPLSIEIQRCAQNVD
jgi:hypothetical protein